MHHRIQILATLVLCAAIGVVEGQEKKGTGQQPEAAKAVKQFLGEWKTVKAEFVGGSPLPEAVLKIRFKFDKKQMALINGPRDSQFEYSLDTKKKMFKMKMLTGRSKGKHGVGFYEFKDKRLHLYVPNGPNGEDPPKDLKDEKAKRLGHFTLERVTSKESAGSKPAPSEKAPAKKNPSK